MIVHSYGSAALLIELDTTADATALQERMQVRPPAGTIETMPGIRTVLVRFDPSATDAESLARTIVDIEIEPPTPSELTTDSVQLRVDYSGPDLDDVAAHTGLSRGDVVDAHQAACYRVLMVGMAPGFYFLSGGDARLRTPRRGTPRTDVPKGALGLAGDLTGIYPRRGPGGWQLIGQVVDDLWHPTRIPAALLAPGTTVRFTAA